MVVFSDKEKIKVAENLHQWQSTPLAPTKTALELGSDHARAKCTQVIIESKS